MIDQKSTLLHWFLNIRRSFGRLSIMGFLVTGGTGFIGSHLVQNLLRHKERVVGLDRAPDPEVVACVASHVSVVQCDLDEREPLAALFRDHEGIDRVVHFAYRMGAESEADPPAAMRVNALGTANLFAEACAHRVKRIVFTSSESVYGRSQALYGDRPVTEDDYCSPRDLVLNYSLTKLLNEHLAAKYEEKFGTEIVSLRIPIVYGPGRKRGTTAWASDFVTLPGMGKLVRLPFPADDWNCYVYVEDVAEEIYALSTKPTLTDRVYNGGGHTVRPCDLAALVRGIIPEAQNQLHSGEAAFAVHLSDGLNAHPPRARVRITFHTGRNQRPYFKNPAIPQSRGETQAMSRTPKMSGGTRRGSQITAHEKAVTSAAS